MAGSLTSLLYTARDALSAQSFGLNVTGQNVTNANTEGYTRRQAVLETRVLGDRTAGTVQIQGIRRATDAFTERRLLEVGGQTASAEERSLQLSTVEPLFNDMDGTGIGSELDAVFSSFGRLATNPADGTARSAVLDALGNFTERVNDTGDKLALQRMELFDKGSKTVDQINQKAQDIAKLNQQISAAETLGQDASDLKDKRNQLLLGLSELVDVTTVTNSKGELLVRVSGATLVEGANARGLSMDLDASGDLRIWSSTVGGPQTDVTRFLTGGKLAGIKEARDTDLKAIQTRLDNFVYQVGGVLNAQHAAGFGLDGVSGRNLFVLGGTSLDAARTLQIDPAVLGNPDSIAAAGSALELPGGSSNAVRLSGLAEIGIAALGNLNPSQAYAELIGDVGLRSATAQQDATIRGALRSQVQSIRESQSGVSLDEEMVALTQYQRGYEAAAKVLKAADDLLNELINGIR